MAFLNYENKRGSGKKLKVHFDLPEDDDYPNHKHSSSSVSSESSLDLNDADYNQNMGYVDSKYGAYGSPVWSYQGGSVTQSPPLQFMNSPGYDPNRIPSSIFNKPTSPMEWSAASNDSLFSIQIGSTSFSRDHAFPLSNKSGELPRTGGGDLASASTMPAATTTLTLPLAPVYEVHAAIANDTNVDMERHSVSSDSSSEAADSVRGRDHEKTSHESDGSVVKKTETTSAAEEVGTDEKVLDKTPDDHSTEAKVPIGEAKNSASVTYRSVGSDMSTRSFQFPILTPEGGRISSSTVESEKQEKSEKQEEEEQTEKPQEPTSPKTEKTQKQSSKTWCFCFSCSPCF